MNHQWQRFSNRSILTLDWNLKGTEHGCCRISPWRMIKRRKGYHSYSQLLSTFITMRQRADLTGSRTIIMWGCCILNWTTVIKNEAARPVGIVLLRDFISWTTVQEKVLLQMRMVPSSWFFWVFLREDIMLLKKKSTREKVNTFISIEEETVSLLSSLNCTFHQTFKISIFERGILRKECLSPFSRHILNIFFFAVNIYAMSS